jgi:PAS domain S-box-containing protein
MPDEDKALRQSVHQVTGPRREVEGRPGLDSRLRHLERKLRETEGHLQSILDSADNLVVYRMYQDRTEPRGAKVVFVSPSVTEIMGVDDPLNHESWFERIHPDDRPRVAEAAHRGLETGKFNQVMRIFHPGKKEWRWIHGMTTAFPEEDGKLFYANGLMIDVTDRMRAQEDLEKTRAELAARTEEMERLNATLGFLMEHRDQERRGFEQNVMENIRVLIRPYLERLRRSFDSHEQASLVNIIDQNLDRITSQFAPGLSSGLSRLTPTEVRVAALIRDGLSSKEIAEVMGVSVATVSGHRRGIRAKLGLKSRKKNLRTYLQHLTDGPPAGRDQ